MNNQTAPTGPNPLQALGSSTPWHSTPFSPLHLVAKGDIGTLTASSPIYVAPSKVDSQEGTEVKARLDGERWGAGMGGRAWGKTDPRTRKESVNQGLLSWVQPSARQFSAPWFHHYTWQSNSHHPSFGKVTAAKGSRWEVNASRKMQKDGEARDMTETVEHCVKLSFGALALHDSPVQPGVD